MLNDASKEKAGVQCNNKVGWVDEFEPVNFLRKTKIMPKFYSLRGEWQNVVQCKECGIDVTSYFSWFDRQHNRVIT